MKELPKSTKVVVIGGGVAGTSCAYHLAKFGWKDVILLERDQLTSGTTWHAAGLLGQLGASSTITKIRKYSLDLYKELEKTTFHIKKVLKTIFRKKSPAVLYGGSVDGNNVRMLKEIKQIDGFLIGGASKSSKKFIDIIKNYYR